jgi:hypothetical protein
MAKMYLPVIAPKDYEAFRKILRDEYHPITLNGVAISTNGRLRTGHSRIQSLKVEISPNSFADYLRQNEYAPELNVL